MAVIAGRSGPLADAAATVPAGSIVQCTHQLASLSGGYRETFLAYRTSVRYSGPMRWDNLTLSDDSAQDALFRVGDVISRTFDTPEFRGMTFYEVRARSILNKVPGGSRMPFSWTLNPYRGCSHACVYCFARRTHEYLELDSGLDFDSKIVVKVNAPELLRSELASPRWTGASTCVARSPTRASDAGC